MGNKTEAEAQLVKAHTANEKLTSELAELRKRQVSLNDLKMRQDDEIERLRSTCNSQGREISDLTHVIKEKDEVIASLNERFLHYEESYNYMMSELMEYKNKAIITRGFIQKYNVVKVSAVKNAACTVTFTQIFAKKDESSGCFFEIVARGKTIVLCGSDIQEVYIHPTNPTRFYIRAVLGTKSERLLFEADEAREVVHNLKEFMGWERSISMLETLQ